MKISIERVKEIYAERGVELTDREAELATSVINAMFIGASDNIVKLYRSPEAMSKWWANYLRATRANDTVEIAKFESDQTYGWD